MSVTLGDHLYQFLTGKQTLLVPLSLHVYKSEDLNRSDYSFVEKVLCYVIMTGLS